jgi:hypothetical protein
MGPSEYVASLNEGARIEVGEVAVYSMKESCSVYI